MHNYQKKVSAMIASGELKHAPGTYTDVSVRHDEWCGIHSRQECNCDPDIVVNSITDVTTEFPTVA